MTLTGEYVLLIIAVLLLVSIVASKVSDKLGVPALLLFLGVGMLAGSEGLGGLQFDQLGFAKFLGSVALVFILFAGGLDTRWHEVKPVLGPGMLLSTLGVLATAIATGWLATVVLDFSWLEGLLLGSIISSTDAPAVFSVLRSRRVSLKGDLKPLLELESGSNDPMAVFLTLGFIHLLTTSDSNLFELFPRFVLDMGIGALLGWFLPKGGLWLINRIRLDYQGLYPVLTLALALLIYALTTALHGNGFLAVYLAGISLGNSKFLHKKSLLRFHEGISWLMQITMFLTLGLLVTPSHIVPVIGTGLLLAIFLALVARPAAVYLCLARSRFNWREKLMISWVGLRGSVPIILSIFPVLAGVARSEMMFNVVFFIVLTSVLLQGTSIPAVAKLLGVDAPLRRQAYVPLDFEEVEGIDANLQDLLIPYCSEVVGKTIFETGVPRECLIVLISREDRFFIPNGSTRLEGGDVLFVLANKQDLIALQRTIARQCPEPKPNEA